METLKLCFVVLFLFKEDFMITVSFCTYKTITCTLLYCSECSYGKIKLYLDIVFSSVVIYL